MNLILFSSISAQLLCGTYDDFDAKVSRVGAFHNAMLSNIKTLQLPKTSSMPITQRIDYLSNAAKNFYQQHEQDYFPEPLPPIMVENVFDQTKSFVNSDSFVMGLGIRGSGVSLDDCLGQVESAKVLDHGNTQIFRDIVNLIKSDQGEATSVTQQKEVMERIANQWLVVNEGKTGNGKELTGSVIAVALKSIEWWRDNPDAVSLFIESNPEEGETSSGPSIGGSGNYNTNAATLLPTPWLDAGGALLSGGFSLINQLIDGNVNWNSVGRSTVGGAAFASAGAAARIGRWLRNLF